MGLVLTGEGWQWGRREGRGDTAVGGRSPWVEDWGPGLGVLAQDAGG